ncbi:hypothetical protein FN846DRAFT_894033 [Sphaerosporella brunnea]|uniref:Uncharacterized protein n=1 Tax=Sphaerosporella brunnea TaxID=1250544 RepID=A0A5J5EKJ7_9PEZI|nr:hypothetical protein FN846DRAFT_894033 [Sphaerosporella brunnea]
MARHKAPAIPHTRAAIRKHNLLHPPPDRAVPPPEAARTPIDATPSPTAEMPVADFAIRDPQQTRAVSASTTTSSGRVGGANQIDSKAVVQLPSPHGEFNVSLASCGGNLVAAAPQTDQIPGTLKRGSDTADRPPEKRKRGRPRKVVAAAAIATDGAATVAQPANLSIHSSPTALGGEENDDRHAADTGRNGLICASNRDRQGRK